MLKKPSGRGRGRASAEGGDCGFPVHGHMRLREGLHTLHLSSRCTNSTGLSHIPSQAPGRPDGPERGKDRGYFGDMSTRASKLEKWGSAEGER